MKQRNAVRATLERKYHGIEHRPPKNGLNDAGQPWAGFSKANKRKPFRREPSWRVAYRAWMLADWRAKRDGASA